MSKARNEKTKKMDVNCNQHLLITAPLIEREPELTTNHSVPLQWVIFVTSQLEKCIT